MSYRGSRQDKARNNDYNTYNRNEVNSSYITNPQTDEEYRAAIAQQQLAYDNSSSKAPMTSAVSANPHGSNLTVRRAGGGQKWEDPTLLDWNPNDFRLFVGNLSGEVTETHLTNAFGKYPSLSKVRVVRDSKSKTQKTKGYGFVAFSDPEDYFRAFKDMNGKYVGGHPVHLKRATTDVKPSKVKRSSPYQRK
ncbi:RNA-binding domain-containing protein [Nadsonia fulvescens var. elongata DSM 6958]|uniref:RNA-binding domain-containing protein n=1 Tax=Nadsonia fulvescens var. elongata DSM 6958 TaxID=857566 RepID=A0A1E3PCW3_9ASCO|nr:RNA-binding domain-containing protein [Nadsonia fulvescens var. elongata DSM 6958]